MAVVNSRLARPSTILLLFLSLLFIQLVFSPFKSIKQPDIFRWKTQSSYKARIAEEESRYDVALRDREDLVKKWGPKPEDVITFPTHGPQYIVWNFFIPAFQCPHRAERIGTLDDGGKWFCGVDQLARQHAPCVIYSFGINGESSFEAAVLQTNPRCEVWGYDFSVNSFGPEIENNPALKARAHFFPYALGGTDSPHSNPPYYTLQTLMEMNGHTFIDVLKVDIEGGEFDSLTSFVNHFVPPGSPPDTVLPIGQLQLEIHLWGQYSPFPVFRAWWENLERVGLRPFWTEPNLVYLLIIKNAQPDLAEYSFMNIRGNHALTLEDY